MTLDDGLLQQARQAKAAMEAVRASARQAEADYQEGVRRLHRAGASVSEVAAGVDISEDAARTILGLELSPELLRCSFCSKSQKKVRKLIAGPGVYICDQCTAAAEASARDQSERCSFCGKSGATVSGMALGPGVNICAECLDLCNEILAQELD